MKIVLKGRLSLLLFLISLSASAQTVDLQWKLAENESLTYKTVMNVVDSSYVEINFGGLFDEEIDSIQEKSKEILNSLRKALDGQDFVTMIASDNDAIKIEMQQVEKESSEDEIDDEDLGLQKMMASLNGGVVLRGEVFKTGDIKSFWVKTNQKNLLSILFELPSEPVKKGDTWELEVSFIGNDHNFNCDSSYRRNEVTLVDIQIKDDETIATLKYDIYEFVSGDFESPFSDKEKITTMLMTHEAIAEFSITNGRWNSYNGVMSYVSTGFMDSNSKTRFALIPVE